jgi:four helix bundle protein
LIGKWRMEIKSFEDLEIYRLARDFRKKVYILASTLPDDEKFNLVLQMKRAALSITNNIAEGYGRYHYQEKIQFCRQSRASVFELIDCFNAILDENFGSKTMCLKLKDDGYKLMKKLNGYIAKTKALAEDKKIEK